MRAHLPASPYVQGLGLAPVAAMRNNRARPLATRCTGQTFRGGRKRDDGTEVHSFRTLLHLSAIVRNGIRHRPTTCSRTSICRQSRTPQVRLSRELTWFLARQRRNFSLSHHSAATNSAQQFVKLASARQLGAGHWFSSPPGGGRRDFRRAATTLRRLSAHVTGAERWWIVPSLAAGAASFWGGVLLVR